jgi:prepilin-type N-terminal cleavage/methylation domain-containing protein
MNKAGYTLIELLVVFLIVGILVAVGFTGLGQKGREIEMGQACAMNLQAIYNAEKRYYIENANTYMPALSANDINVSTAAFSGISIQDGNFTYQIQCADATGAPIQCATAGAIGFTVTATRTGGSYCPGAAMTIDQTGVVNHKACSIWVWQ